MPKVKKRCAIDSRTSHGSAAPARGWKMGAALHKAGRLGADWHGGAARPRGEGCAADSRTQRTKKRGGRGSGGERELRRGRERQRGEGCAADSHTQWTKKRGGRRREGEGGAGPISIQRTKVPSADRATPTFMMTMGDTWGGVIEGLYSLVCVIFSSKRNVIREKMSNFAAANAIQRVKT